uniref:ATP-grasp domain-containing protein n=1 Tax=Panagrolaimus davidi TaxID=227884 RepID=A0A914PA34_9BILA
MTVLDMDILDSLNSKQIIGILIRARFPFFTPLPDFQKPSDAALIGIFPSDFKQKLFKGYEKHFDAIFWFTMDEEKENAFRERSHLDEFEELSEIEEIVSNIIKVLPKEKIDLIIDDEALIKIVCNIREKYDIQGPKPKDVEYLRDKALLKMTAKEKGIPTMKFTIFDPRKVESIEVEIGKIMKEIKTFPIFRKPIIASGSYGSEKISNMEELEEFVTSEVKNNNQTCYLMEECIDGKDMTEFWAYSILLPDGTCVPYSCVFTTQGLTHAEHLKKGCPILFQGLPFEECEDRFPKLAEFLVDVANKLKPPAPHVFAVQGFQLRPNTSEYLLTEVAYRIGGGRDTPATYFGTGISQETAVLSCHLNPNYQIRRDPNSPAFRRLFLWYPCVNGTLKNQKGIKKSSPITSNLEYQWYKIPGEKMEIAQSTSDYLLCLKIDNINLKEAQKDADWIAENYTPHVKHFY